MRKQPKNDPDQRAEVHENVRESEEGVERKGAPTKGESAAGLIGDGRGVDPRYVSQR